MITVKAICSRLQYLAVPLSSSCVFQMACDHFISKARTPLGAALEILGREKVSNWDSKMTLFLSLVESVLFYGVEVWGGRYLEDIEVVQSRFLKRLLNLPFSTPGCYLRLETGRLKLKVNALKRMMKYWIRILEMKEDRLPRICLTQLVQLDVRECNLPELNWATQLRGHLSIIGSDDVCFDADAVTVKRKLLDMCERWENHCFSLDIESCPNSRYNNHFPKYALLVQVLYPTLEVSAVRTRRE
uniref:RNA-directed DNA polymerase from mobile element jockey n=1 Tax=Lygus hesperus TaxID=30085 RepID=A0A0A9Z8G1_LYGHE